MKHGILVALSIVAVGCAGAEPVVITPAQAPPPAEVTVDARPAPQPAAKPQAADAKPAEVEPAEVKQAEAKPADGPTPKPADDKKGAQFGIIGLLNTGNDPDAAQGNMWGASVGDAQGYGGLGLGGGGRGEGIGLGSIGALGHGAGTGQGFGFGHGRLGGSRGKPPQIRLGAMSVSGRLPPEVIQRIVRQSYGRFRLCYENGLRNSPNLQGRISVKFVIGRDGNVGNASSLGSDIPSADVVACVVKAVRGLSFPQPEGGQVVVTYPIMFSPGDPPAKQDPPPPPKQDPPPPTAGGSKPATTESTKKN
ncbi:MAG: AgmX/PglI C-terminal domain-containing protein [Minicystis sp.]